VEVGLLVVAHEQFGGNGLEVAEEAACSVVGAGSEIELGGRCARGVVAAGGSAVAGAEGPEAIDCERLPGRVLDQADELAGGEIVGGDGSATLSVAATGELADEQVVAIDAEVERREGYAPGCIEPVPVFQTLQKLTI
jgi:hypothetical protein